MVLILRETVGKRGDPDCIVGVVTILAHVYKSYMYTWVVGACVVAQRVCISSLTEAIMKQGPASPPPSPPPASKQQLVKKRNRGTQVPSPKGDPPRPPLTQG